jgi:hypothetical protein
MTSRRPIVCLPLLVMRVFELLTGRQGNEIDQSMVSAPRARMKAAATKRQTLTLTGTNGSEDLDGLARVGHACNPPGAGARPQRSRRSHDDMRDQDMASIGCAVGMAGGDLLGAVVFLLRRSGSDRRRAPVMVSRFLAVHASFCLTDTHPPKLHCMTCRPAGHTAASSLQEVSFPITNTQLIHCTTTTI